MPLSLPAPVRPEFVSFAAEGVPVEVTKVSDTGRHRLVETRASGTTIKVLLADGAEVPEGTAHLHFDPAFTRVYRDGWLRGAS